MDASALVSRHRLTAKELDLPSQQTLGSVYYEVEICSSTNDIVSEMGAMDGDGDDGFAEGTIVRADEQTAGRGRRGSEWFSSPNNLQFSMLLRPPAWVQDLPFINVLFSYAVMKTVYSLYQGGVRPPLMVKWPNDLTVHGKKLCGVMSEMRTRSGRDNFIVVGCGLNLNVRRDDFPAELRSQATSLLIETGQPLSHDEFLETFLPTLSALYANYIQASH